MVSFEIEFRDLYLKPIAMIVMINKYQINPPSEKKIIEEIKDWVLRDIHDKICNEDDRSHYEKICTTETDEDIGDLVARIVLEELEKYK